MPAPHSSQCTALLNLATIDVMLIVSCHTATIGESSSCATALMLLGSAYQDLLNGEMYLSNVRHEGGCLRAASATATQSHHQHPRQLERPAAAEAACSKMMHVNCSGRSEICPGWDFTPARIDAVDSCRAADPSLATDARPRGL